MAHAVACAERRAAAHDDERAVLVHGDVHQWNALRRGDGLALVDPDGLLAEPEYDLGILMREDPVELMTGDPRDRARWLARPAPPPGAASAAACLLARGGQVSGCSRPARWSRRRRR